MSLKVTHFLSPSLRSIPFRAEMGAKSFPVPPSLLTTQRNCAVPKEKKLGDCTTRVCYVAHTHPARRQEDRGDSAECLSVEQSIQYPSPLFSPERMRGKTMCVLCRCVLCRPLARWMILTSTRRAKGGKRRRWDSESPSFLDT